MTTFQTFSDLTPSDLAEYRRITAIPSGQRSSTESAFVTARSDYVDNEIVSLDADGNIQEAKGNSLPTGYSGFAKGAIFIKKDVIAGSFSRYENTGDTTTAAWNLAGSIATGDIADSAITAQKLASDAVETAKIKDANVTAAKLAATLDLNGKTVQVPSGTPVNAVAASKALTQTGDALEGQTVSIGGRVYEVDSNSSVGAGNVAIDVSGGGTPGAATGTLTLTNPVSDGETITVGSRVYEIDANSSVSGGNVAADVSAGTKVQATGTLTISGVVIDTETVTVGSEVYEFDGGDGVTGGRTAVDVSASMTAAQGTLTIGGAAPANNETIVVGAKTYTWKDTLTGAANELKIGITVDDCIDAFVAAINAAAGAGTLYGTGTTANAQASATKSSGTVAILTARKKGTVGNAIATTETMGDVGNVFDAATLGTTTAGADCTAANAVTALVSSFNTNSAYAITASDGAGDTVVFTADAAGALDGSAGNAIATTEGMANGSFGAATLTGGTDATAAQAVTAIVAAIQGDGSAVVTAADGAGDTVDLTAKVKGTAANAYATTETLANGSFGAATLTGGTDEGSTDFITALVSAINGDASAVVTAVDSGGGICTVTAKIKGTSGNAIAIAETLTNGSWAGGATFLSGGVDGTVGAARQVFADGSYLYVASAANTVADANWRRLTLGSAY